MFALHVCPPHDKKLAPPHSVSTHPVVCAFGFSVAVHAHASMLACIFLPLFNVCTCTYLYMHILVHVHMLHT